MLVEGLTNVQIAGRMAVPEAMVRTYLSEIYRKLGLPGREAAARYARDRGLVD
jgi:DNA-binding NarL/FixJ family response regulator